MLHRFTLPAKMLACLLLGFLGMMVYDAGKSLYLDYQFLHINRLRAEQQAMPAPAPAPTPR